MAQYKGPAKEYQRIQHLTKKRERELENVESKKIGIADQLKVDKINNKFSKKDMSVESNLESCVSGLRSVSEMKKEQENARRKAELLQAQKIMDREKVDMEKEKDRQRKKLKQQQQIKNLSFCIDDSIEELDMVNEIELLPKFETNYTKEMDEKCTPSATSRRYGKDPFVNTSFLPDIDREKEESELRQLLAEEWNAKQQQIKDEKFEITYSYWDGVGHRRSEEMKKGDTIYRFLLKCLENLRRDFPELKAVTADQLVFVKEDIIIPQTNTFYDFMITKARGKSGPLFNYDVIDDIRLQQDATIEKQDSHAGKIVLRSWYERNKHIFPASRWEPFDPLKTYENYTLRDK